MYYLGHCLPLYPFIPPTTHTRTPSLRQQKIAAITLFEWHSICRRMASDVNSWNSHWINKIALTFSTALTPIVVSRAVCENWNALIFVGLLSVCVCVCGEHRIWQLIEFEMCHATTGLLHTDYRPDMTVRSIYFERAGCSLCFVSSLINTKLYLALWMFHRCIASLRFHTLHKCSFKVAFI